MPNCEFNTENLLSLLREAVTKIEAGELSQDNQRRVWDALVWDKEDPENKKALYYLFLGQMISNMSNGGANDN